MTQNSKIIVKVDPDLEDLIPIYIETKRKDILNLREALESGDYEKIRLLGHSMKGSGGGYGLDEISRIGRSIEEAVKEKEDDVIKAQVNNLESYIENLEVIYE